MHIKSGFFMLIFSDKCADMVCTGSSNVDSLSRAGFNTSQKCMLMYASVSLQCLPSSVNLIILCISSDVWPIKRLIEVCAQFEMEHYCFIALLLLIPSRHLQ